MGRNKNDKIRTWNTARLRNITSTMVQPAIGENIYNNEIKI